MEDVIGVSVLGTGGGVLVFTAVEELDGAGEGYSQVKDNSSERMTMQEVKQEKQSIEKNMQ